MDHHFASIMIVEEGFFFYFGMLVNANECRVAIRVFNNRSFIATKKCHGN